MGTMDLLWNGPLEMAHMRKQGCMPPKERTWVDPGKTRKPQKTKHTHKTNKESLQNTGAGGREKQNGLTACERTHENDACEKSIESADETIKPLQSYIV